jgi:hypothetical protein
VHVVQAAHRVHFLVSALRLPPAGGCLFVPRYIQQQFYSSSSGLAQPFIFALISALLPALLLGLAPSAARYILHTTAALHSLALARLQLLLLA